MELKNNASIFNMFSLQNKVVVVTGGTGLFGTPISGALAAAGGHVIITSRNVIKAQEAAQHLNDKGFTAEGLGLDLADEKSIETFYARIENDHGKIDVLVNNAVSREGYKSIEETSWADWEQSQTVNSNGLFLICKNTAEMMKEQKQGVIINIGSIQGAVGPNFKVYGNTGMTSPPGYSFHKWGMVGLTKWMANYYGKYNIRVNCLSPGGYGPGVENQYGETEFTQNYKQLTPLGRFANDEDIQGPVLFLASAASSYITGHHLLVDGGWTSW